MLVDASGKIVFKGHPASRPDLVKDFDTLLAGEAITGDGTVPEGGAKAEDIKGEALDVGKVHEEIDSFKTGAAATL